LKAILKAIEGAIEGVVQDGVEKQFEKQSSIIDLPETNLKSSGKYQR